MIGEAMKHLSIQSAGTGHAVEGIHAVVLYDKKDGRVCHMHHVITFAGGTRHPISEHERNALAYAEKLGHKGDSLQTLHVPNFQPFAMKYRVNLKSKTLIEEKVTREKKNK
jgi:hypothetical protein